MAGTSRRPALLNSAARHGPARICRPRHPPLRPSLHLLPPAAAGAALAPVLLLVVCAAAAAAAPGSQSPPSPPVPSPGWQAQLQATLQRVEAAAAGVLAAAGEFTEQLTGQAVAAAQHWQAHRPRLHVAEKLLGAWDMLTFALPQPLREQAQDAQRVVERHFGFTWRAAADGDEGRGKGEARAPGPGSGSEESSRDQDAEAGRRVCTEACPAADLPGLLDLLTGIAQEAARLADCGAFNQLWADVFVRLQLRCLGSFPAHSPCAGTGADAIDDAVWELNKARIRVCVDGQGGGGGGER